MTEALHFEWVRIRTLRSTYWLIAAALTLNTAIALAAALATRNEPQGHELVGAAVTGGGPYTLVPFAAVFLAVTGILATGHEYRYGTSQPTLTTVPRRSTLLAAKLTVLAAVALAVTTLSLLVDIIAVVLVWGEASGLTAEPLLGYVALVLLWTVLGAALAQLFRGVPTALVVILVVPLIVEQLILSLSYITALHWLTPAVKFLPFMAGQQLVNLGEKSDIEFYARWTSGGVFAAFVAIILTAAWILFTRRDA
jgi:ABC-type transport system involved in multi-copper enzyme maturation permease subunit